MLTRLTVAEYGSHFQLLALLERFSAPMVLPMARAAIRSIGTAVDVWPEADTLIGQVRALGGLDPVEGADPDLAAAVESDAIWALGMASILRVLRARSVSEMAPHLDIAHRLLDVATEAHGRPDAAAMLAVVDVLRDLVDAIVAGSPGRALEGKALSADVLGDLRAQVLNFSIGRAGWTTGTAIASRRCSLHGQVLRRTSTAFASSSTRMRSTRLKLSSAIS